jgi:putative spermidine/putrescine transport system substrate-binding protein
MVKIDADAVPRQMAHCLLCPMAYWVVAGLQGKAMTRIPSHAEDVVDMAVERYHKGGMSRRQFVAGLAALGFAPVFLTSGRAAGQVKQIVLVNWGGDAVKYFELAWAKPYSEESGVNVLVDGSGPSLGKMKAMVESGAVTWDVCDSGAGTAIELAPTGVLRPIDYSIVDKSKLFPGFAYSHGMTNYMYSFVLGFNSAKVPHAPQSWVDFWNLKDFPGMRSMRKDILGHLEIALMGTGMAASEIYPMTPEKEKLAFERLRLIKDHTLYWAGGAESQTLMRNGEVVMGVFWNTRLKVVNEETKGRWDWIWNQGIVSPGAWVVLTNNPAGDAIWPFLASTQVPERQIVLLKAFANAPANPQAAALVPPELKKINATDPDNYKLQLPVDNEWYGVNYSRVNTLYLDMIAS